VKLIFDKSSFLSRLEGDEQLAAEIIAMFLSECPKLLADVRAAAEQRNAPALERATHKLKGSVAEICALQAARAARILEELAREGKIQDVGAALEKLEAALQRLMQELHDLRM
jgi:HPt (histidine-containing phosphotransfer) domain-containing protein